MLGATAVLMPACTDGFTDFNTNPFVTPYESGTSTGGELNTTDIAMPDSISQEELDRFL